MAQNKSITALVVTYGNKGFPHLDALEKSNPNIQIIPVYDNRFLGNSKEAWRTTDNMLRIWWMNHRDLANGEIIWWLEWDCLVTTKLPKLKDGADFGGKQIWTSSAWPYWKEKSGLGLFEKYAIGLAPFGATVFRRHFLTMILHHRFDHLYNKDLFSEIRTSSCLMACGAKPTRIKMSDVWCHPPSKPFVIKRGIYHPVKQ